MRMKPIVHKKLIIKSKRYEADSTVVLANMALGGEKIVATDLIASIKPYIMNGIAVSLMLNRYGR
jgi:uncharacterized glyoxalase superfamily protein PhnB